MSWTTYYTFTNTGATWAKPKLDKSTGKIATGLKGEIKYSSDVEGSCFGYAFDWARRMVNYGGNIVKSEPNKAIGTALQQMYEMRTKKAGGNWAAQNSVAVPQVVRLGSLSLVESYRHTDTDMANKVDADNSIVIFSIGFHWMAMGKATTGRFFFDSNYGLISADSLASYRDLVDSFIDDYDGEAAYSTSWDVYSLGAG